MLIYIEEVVQNSYILGEYQADRNVNPTSEHE